MELPADNTTQPRRSGDTTATVASSDSQPVVDASAAGTPEPVRPAFVGGITKREQHLRDQLDTVASDTQFAQAKGEATPEEAAFIVEKTRGSQHPLQEARKLLKRAKARDLEVPFYFTEKWRAEHAPRGADSHQRPAADLGAAGRDLAHHLASPDMPRPMLNGCEETPSPQTESDALVHQEVA